MNRNRMKRRRRSRETRILVFVLAAIVSLLLIRTPGPEASASEKAADLKVSYTMYVVEPGDTIWDIAQDRLSEAFPTSRAYTREVIRANGMKDSRIYPGDLLMIPEGEEEDPDSLASLQTP